MCTTCVPGHIGIWNFRIESECSSKHRFPGNKDNFKDLRAEPDFKRILKLLYPRNGQWLLDIHLKLFLFPRYYALQKHWNENYVIQSRFQHNSTRTFNSKLKKTKRVLHQSALEKYPLVSDLWALILTCTSLTCTGTFPVTLSKLFGNRKYVFQVQGYFTKLTAFYDWIMSKKTCS